jgi:two-component system KDP operon response regulator KdpE
MIRGAPRVRGSSLLLFELSTRVLTLWSVTTGRILVVDDEPQIRRVLRATLTAQGYEVQDARTGEDALNSIRASRFDLVLLDMSMPGMGGLETCRTIRATSEVAIIVLTVHDAEQDKVASLDAGADDYITKPFSTPELLARIRAALRRQPATSEPAGENLRLGEVEINFAARRVIGKDREIRLTPKEFDLLQYFVANPNVAIPHGRLLQAVWGPDYGNEVEYLRVFVNQLRMKIEPDPSHPRYLLTEPWVGYRFAPGNLTAD